MFLAVCLASCKESRSQCYVGQSICNNLCRVIVIHFVFTRSMRHTFAQDVREPRNSTMLDCGGMWDIASKCESESGKRHRMAMSSVAIPPDRSCVKCKMNEGAECSVLATQAEPVMKTEGSFAGAKETKEEIWQVQEVCIIFASVKRCTYL
jgi:hypothetical protein